MLKGAGAYEDNSAIQGDRDIDSIEAADLLKAVVMADAVSVRGLLDSGTDVDARDERGRTALIAAAAFGDTEILGILLDAGADVNALQNSGPGWTPLALSVRTCAPVAAVRLLLAKGAEPDATNKLGYTALTGWWSWNGNVDVTLALIDAGANVEGKHPSGYTPLMHAAFLGHTPVVKALITAGADINAAHSQGGYALFPNHIGGRTALMYACETGRIRTVDALLASGVDVNARDDNGVTALMLAAENGYIDIVRSLLEADVNIDAKDEDGRSALRRATDEGYSAIIEMLDDSGG